MPLASSQRMKAKRKEKKSGKETRFPPLTTTAQSKEKRDPLHFKGNGGDPVSLK
jgi:hypothetical protein